MAQTAHGKLTKIIEIVRDPDRQIIENSSVEQTVTIDLG